MLNLLAELAVVAGRSHDNPIMVSAGLPQVSCSFRHPHYHKQLYTSALLAQGEAMLLACNIRVARHHVVHSSVLCTASASLY